MKFKKNNRKILIAFILIVGVFWLFILPDTNCIGEYEHITTGVSPQYQEECCNGLVLRSPEGYTGGAWCVNPACFVEYLTGYEELLGLSGEGIYTICSYSSGIAPTKLR